MPKKVNHSHMMSTSEFFAKWNIWRPLAFKVVISNYTRMPLSDSPEFGSTDDVVSHICIEMHRLGVFARYDVLRCPDEAKYIGNQVLAIIKHKWQDICRLTKAGAPSYLNTDADVESPYKYQSEQVNTIAEIREAYAPDYDFSLGMSPPDDKASLSMAITAITNALPDPQGDARVPLAVQALNLMRRNPALASDCSTPMLASALGITKEATRGVRAILIAAATATA